ncbi:UNVERIFIED_CONTAM: putative receptor-like protein kinase [Sesamum radiatum]|uniref:Receptor-like protein kinase n=1 Tax=Sesamum radiatum TaxID=300843 RepID=A0AAW2VL33_SESRA
MKFLFLLVLPIWVFSSPLFSAPLYGPATSPVAHPVLPADKDPSFKGSADLTALSPEVAKVKVVHHQDLNRKILIALVVASSLLGGILLLLSCFSLYRLKRLKECNAKSNQSSDAGRGISLVPILDKLTSRKIGGKKGSVTDIEYQLLAAATNNFEEGNVVGEGGLGRVYKAYFNDHLRAAVKKIYVRGRKLKENMRSALTWHQRMKIALDVARGLEYLHEHCNPPVIHRDLKPSNILLIPTSMPRFLILALQLLEATRTRQIANLQELWAMWLLNTCWMASPQLTDRSKLPNIVDPAIRNTMDLKHLYQVAAIAVLCVQPEASYRPLITDVLHSFIPLVPAELGGSLRVTDSSFSTSS